MTHRLSVQLADLPGVAAWLQARGAAPAPSRSDALYAPQDASWTPAELARTAHLLRELPTPGEEPGWAFQELEAHAHCDEFDEHVAMEARFPTRSAAERFLHSYRLVQSWRVEAEVQAVGEGELRLERAYADGTLVAATLVLVEHDPAPVVDELRGRGLRAQPMRELEPARLLRLTEEQGVR